MFFLNWISLYATTQISTNTYEFLSTKHEPITVEFRPISRSDRAFLDQTYGASGPMKSYMDGSVRSKEEINQRFVRYLGWTNTPQNPWIHMLAFIISAHTSTHLKPGDFIGDFMIEPEGEKAAELSYVLTEKCWGKGLGSNIIGILLDQVIPKLPKKISRIEATVRIDNIASIRVLEKNGFMSQESIVSVRSAELALNASLPADRLLYVRVIPRSPLLK